MDKLLTYLNSLSPAEREAFAKRCDTTVGYLRKAGSIKQKLSEVMCLRLSAESDGVLQLTELRSDVDWDYFTRALATTVRPLAQVATARQVG